MLEEEKSDELSEILESRFSKRGIYTPDYGRDENCGTSWESGSILKLTTICS